ncbi:MAG: ATPase, T2SS/T4P/T4SS family [Acidimicrobiales bacterium]
MEISILPYCRCRSVGGEHCVVHLRDRARDRLALHELGMTSGVCALYTELARSPSGMIVVSGPARSGKTTTMLATLDLFDHDELSVMTVEDSIDVVVPGVNQFRIDTSAGETFAAGLVSIARQDPDVILVGEMPDIETARHAVRAALTGQFVVTAVHATDAVDALWRLLDVWRRATRHCVDSHRLRESAAAAARVRQLCPRIHAFAPRPCLLHPAWRQRERAVRTGRGLRSVRAHWLPRSYRRIRSAAAHRCRDS